MQVHTKGIIARRTVFRINKSLKFLFQIRDSNTLILKIITIGLVFGSLAELGEFFPHEFGFEQLSCKASAQNSHENDVVKQLRQLGCCAHSLIPCCISDRHRSEHALKPKILKVGK